MTRRSTLCFTYALVGIALVGTGLTALDGGVSNFVQGLGTTLIVLGFLFGVVTPSIWRDRSSRG